MGNGGIAHPLHQEEPAVDKNHPYHTGKAEPGAAVDEAPQCGQQFLRPFGSKRPKAERNLPPASSLSREDIQPLLLSLLH